MAVAVQAIEDRPQLGILMMLGAWFLFALVDTSAKWLVLAAFPAFQLAFMRYAVHFIISIGVIAKDGIDPDRFKTGHIWQVLSRALLLISATLGNFYALNFLPLTVISAIMFSSPIIVCFLSMTILKEHIGPWRWSAILLGFAGVLIVIRPFGEAFHPAMILPLYNATALALYSLMTRKLAGVVAVETQQFYLGALGTLLLLPFALWTWVPPSDPLADHFTFCAWRRWLGRPPAFDQRTPLCTCKYADALHIFVHDLHRSTQLAHFCARPGHLGRHRRTGHRYVRSHHLEKGTAAMTRVAAIGEAMIELSLQNDIAKVGVAGDSLNTAIYLKRNAPEISVDYMTCLGDDPFSDQIETFIARQSIGTSQCKRITDKSPGLYAITTTEDGERSFTYWRSASAARDVFKSGDGYDFSQLCRSTI